MGPVKDGGELGVFLSFVEFFWGALGPIHEEMTLQEERRPNPHGGLKDNIQLMDPGPRLTPMKLPLANRLRRVMRGDGSNSISNRMKRASRSGVLPPFKS